MARITRGHGAAKGKRHERSSRAFEDAAGVEDHPMFNDDCRPWCADLSPQCDSSHSTEKPSTPGLTEVFPTMVLLQCTITAPSSALSHKASCTVRWMIAPRLVSVLPATSSAVLCSTVCRLLPRTNGCLPELGGPQHFSAKKQLRAGQSTGGGNGGSVSTARKSGGAGAGVATGKSSDK